MGIPTKPTGLHINIPKPALIKCNNATNARNSPAIFHQFEFILHSSYLRRVAPVSPVRGDLFIDPFAKVGKAPSGATCRPYGAWPCGTVHDYKQDAPNGAFMLPFAILSVSFAHHSTTRRFVSSNPDPSSRNVHAFTSSALPVKTDTMMYTYTGHAWARSYSDGFPGESGCE